MLCSRRAELIRKFGCARCCPSESPGEFCVDAAFANGKGAQLKLAATQSKDKFRRAGRILPRMFA
jgi:hypothetical protein